ncbi:hypothetical protein KIN20_036629 [Parelaphostrongylus tenuis]|uniref:Uncharacterized protein n=1 Tax=Parelaphostrongylus tenuis TaxID=148309 RepID=A0AAD5RDE9_PARTN|nr:hypothetical protein KIN20_036629 [Parelaphostrongylus tenuis]
MDATRPTRVGFDPRVERICSHTVTAFDAFRFSPGFNRLLHCAVVGRTPHVRRESGSIPVLSAFAHIPLPLSTPSVFLPIYRLLRCAVVGWTPHVRRESGSIPVLSAFAHIRLPLSTPSVFRPDFNSLLRCEVVGRTPHVRQESVRCEVVGRTPRRPTRVGFDPRVERICSHTVTAFDAFRILPGF